MISVFDKCDEKGSGPVAHKTVHVKLEMEAGIFKALYR